MRYQLRVCVVAIGFCIPIAALAATPEDTAKALYKDGQDAFHAGRFLDAAKAFDDAYGLSHRPELLYNIGLAYRRAFSIDGMPAHLRQALFVFRTFASQAPTPAAKAAAETNIRAVVGQLASLDEDARRGLSGAAESPALREAMALQDQNRFAEALAKLKVVETDRKSGRTALIEVYQREGEILAQLGRADEAEIAFRKLLALDPDFAGGDLPTQDARSALADARVALRLTPSSDEGLFAIGDAPSAPPRSHLRGELFLGGAAAASVVAIIGVVLFATANMSGLQAQSQIRSTAPKATAVGGAYDQQVAGTWLGWGGLVGAAGLGSAAVFAW